MNEITIDGPHGLVRARTYLPTDPTGHGLVWLHGGGFLGGDLDMPEAEATAQAFAEHGIVVVSVDYQLAPERTEVTAGEIVREGVVYPIAHDEVVAAFRWALTSHLATTWSIGGASAGGNLAAGAALHLADDGDAPALAVLAYPTLHAVQDAPDSALRALLDANPDADHFGPASVLSMYENYLGRPIETAAPYAIPGTASAARLAVFPPTIMINNETDELRVSGEAFARTLAEAGVDIDVSTEPGTVHGHLNRPGAAATASIERFAARILALDTKEQS